MVGTIRVEDGVSEYHVSRIRRASDDLPSDAAIAVVQGNREEDAPEEYTKKLEGVAAEIAARVRDIRDFALRNADALAHAVAMLRERDRHSAGEARTAAALIDDLAHGATPPVAKTQAVTPFNDGAAARSGFGG